MVITLNSYNWTHWSNSNSLHIGHCSRASKHSNISREWRLKTGFPLFPFKTLNQGLGKRDVGKWTNMIQKTAFSCRNVSTIVKQCKRFSILFVGSIQSQLRFVLSTHKNTHTPFLLHICKLQPLCACKHQSHIQTHTHSSRGSRLHRPPGLPPACCSLHCRTLHGYKCKLQNTMYRYVQSCYEDIVTSKQHTATDKKNQSLRINNT